MSDIIKIEGSYIEVVLMPIDPLYGFDAKSEIGRSPVPKPSPGPMPTSYSSTSPKEKIQKLYSLFPNKFGNYFIFDKPFVEHTGRVNFVTQDHRKLFFSRLYKYNKDICIKYLKEYSEHDNYFYINNDEKSKQEKQEKDFILKLYHETLIETIPKNLIQFIYLNGKFSDWPVSEQRRFLIFIKTVGGKDALKEFKDFQFMVQDVEKSERGFREWLGEQKIIPKWLDKYGNPDMIAKINFIEKLFSKLDDIVIPKIIALPHDPSHPEKDPRYTLLCEYAYFIVARNAINPISWYVGLCSITKLSEEWDKIVYLCKSGSPEEFALFLGQIIGTLLAIPLGIKVGSLARTKVPIAIATVKAIIKKATKGKIDPAKIDKVLNRAIFSKKPVSKSRQLKPKDIKIIKLRKNLRNRFDNAKTIKDKFLIADEATKHNQYVLAARLYLRIAKEMSENPEEYFMFAYELKKSALIIKLASISDPKNKFLRKSFTEIDEIASKFMDKYRPKYDATSQAENLQKEAALKNTAEEIKAEGLNVVKKLREDYAKAKNFEGKLNVIDTAMYSLIKEYELASEMCKNLIADLLKSKKPVDMYAWKLGEVYYRLYYMVKADLLPNAVLRSKVEAILESATNMIRRTGNWGLVELIKLRIKERYGVNIKL